MKGADSAAPPGGLWPTTPRSLAIALLVVAVALSAVVSAIPPVAAAVAVLFASVLVLALTPRATPSGGVWARWILPFVPFVLLMFVAVGLNALSAELPFGFAAAVLAGAFALALARWRLRKPRWAVRTVVVLGAVFVPVLALLGFDALWSAANWDIPAQWFSFTLGAVLIGLGTWLYLRPWWVREPNRHPLWATFVVVLALVLGQPVAALVITAGDDKGSSGNKTREVAVSELDVIVLRDGADQTALALPKLVQGWGITTWVGQVTGTDVSWGTNGRPPRRPRPKADRVLLLAVDGTPARFDNVGTLPEKAEEQGEVARWLRVADAITRTQTPTVALLQTTQQTRLANWEKELTPAPDVADGQRHGQVMSVQGLRRDRTLVDLALRSAVHSPTADEDLALAAKHRPALFFDSGETYGTPLNIEKLLASEKMKLCDKGHALRASCETVSTSADLHNDADHLSFNPKDLAEIRDESTIYVNVIRSVNGDSTAVYLDYWWYFPHNPSGAGRGALCGVGFVLAGVTCFDHQSDWEGVTVVLDGDTDPPSPTAVQYAQHTGTARYPWATLQSLWRAGAGGGEIGRIAKRFRQTIDTGQRPLVFVARGTHASYPKSCAADACRIAGILLSEKRHDGKQAWPGNVDGGCTSICVTALPTHRTGNGRALWNAFDGPWGTKNCLAFFICASSEPPPAPGAQDRYQSPWCGRDYRKKATESEKCPERAPPPAKGPTLLALGDSFSSGQGAGNYDTGTTGRGNTCFRSPGAWPQVLSRTLGYTPLPALACSGARISHVTSNRTDGQRERRESQIGRIAGNPDIITLSIGGNDAGFAKVLGRCVRPTDCTQRYDKPRGDVLESGIADVVRELPGVYRAIRSAAPRARIVVSGYPRLFPRAVPENPPPNCAAWDWISSKEAIYLNARARSLNAGIARAALAANIHYVDVTDAFDGNELRCKGERYVHKLTARRFRQSFHPTEAGHERLAAVVAAGL